MFRGFALVDFTLNRPFKVLLWMSSSFTMTKQALHIIAVRTGIHYIVESGSRLKSAVQ